MQLILKNIGCIQDAFIEINGITVIAGENNTGKSTISRALFSIFNGFSQIQEHIQKEKQQSINKKLKSLFKIFPLDINNIDKRSKSITTKILGNIEYYKSLDKREFNIELKNLIFNSLEELSFKLNDISNIDDILNTFLFSYIYEFLRMSDNDLKNKYIYQKLNNEFNGQIENIYSSNKISEINLKIKDNFISIYIDNEKHSLEIKNPKNILLTHETFYIDNPFILDRIKNQSNSSYIAEKNSLEHRAHLYKKLSSINKRFNTIDAIFADNNMKNVYYKLRDIVDGDVFFNEDKAFVYKKHGSDKELKVKNLSAGFKSFLIFKILIENNSIQENDTIILDEPEVHLHPEWQILFAEFIVLLQKNFNLHILLNTHSPYFLEAIEVYTKKYNIEHICNYYLTEVENETFFIKDVTNNTNEIYSKLAQAFKDLKLEEMKL